MHGSAWVQSTHLTDESRLAKNARFRVGAKHRPYRRIPAGQEYAALRKPGQASNLARTHRLDHGSMLNSGVAMGGQ